MGNARLNAEVSYVEVVGCGVFEQEIDPNGRGILDIGARRGSRAWWCPVLCYRAHVCCRLLHALAWSIELLVDVEISHQLIITTGSIDVVNEDGRSGHACRWLIRRVLIRARGPRPWNGVTFLCPRWRMLSAAKACILVLDVTFVASAVVAISAIVGSRVLVLISVTSPQYIACSYGGAPCLAVGGIKTFLSNLGAPATSRLGFVTLDMTPATAVAGTRSQWGARCRQETETHHPVVFRRPRPRDRRPLV